jgi:hypothetical protein
MCRSGRLSISSITLLYREAKKRVVAATIAPRRRLRWPPEVRAARGEGGGVVPLFLPGGSRWPRPPGPPRTARRREHPLRRQRLPSPDPAAAWPLSSSPAVLGGRDRPDPRGRLAGVDIPCGGSDFRLQIRRRPGWI